VKNQKSADELNKLDLICFSHLRWDYVFQRPQHLMSRAARDQRVFFVEEPRFHTDDPKLEVRTDSSGVNIVTPWLTDGRTKDNDRRDHIVLIDRLVEEYGLDEFIAWYYTPMALGFSAHLRPRLTVYDCMDELSAFNGAPAHLQEYEEELLARADLVLTGGYSLYEAKRDLHPNVHAFPSSIDVPHFRKARDYDPDREPVEQFALKHPRLGYFGVIDERLDLPLIAAVAKAHPEWELILVGPIAKRELRDLPQAANIHYLGRKDYQELPDYLAGWDVALLPFAINDATRFISPTKTPEYLAGGRPVVSTPVADVVKPYGEMGLVHIAEGPEAFIAGIEQALSDNWDWADWINRVDDFLSTMSWDDTWLAIHDQMRAALETAGQRAETLVPVTGGNGGNGNGNGYSNGGRRPSQPGFDYLIVGAGFAGSVLAERLASGSGKRVLIIDRRNHIGGNAYDHYNDEGILIHRYGPHIFHTNSREVFAYLSEFTDWRQYEHRVLASVDGLLVPMPINLDTINKLYGTNYTSLDLEQFYKSVAEPREKIETSEDVVVSKVGRELYLKFFRNYTRKQWDLDPSELDSSVTSRVPVRLNRDDRYFSDTFQAMPTHGYTRMFEKMLDHPNIKVMLNTDYRDVAGLIPYKEMVFTGPVDEYFNYRFGRLPYRSLRFHFETLNKEWHQPVAVINYPNEHLYTRATEFKHLTGQLHPKTTLVYEYPQAEGDPYYPIPRPENAALYEKYRKLAEATQGVHFAGRLATYKYYNMDQVTAQALAVYGKIAGVRREKAATEHKPKFIPVAKTSS
jgi:UDP-galactopyranose mutase